MSAAAVAPTRSVGRGGKSDFLHHPITRNVLPFLNGGAAGMIATSFIQPVDMVKVCIITFSLSLVLFLEFFQAEHYVALALNLANRHHDRSLADTANKL